MSMIDSRVVNIDELKLEHFEKGDKFDSDAVRIGPLLGAKDLGYSYDVVPPGKTLVPVPQPSRRGGDVLHRPRRRGRCATATRRARSAPATSSAARRAVRKPRTRSSTTRTAKLAYLSVSTMMPAEVCEYPDSGKVGAFGGGLRHMTRVGDHVDYWIGRRHERALRLARASIMLSADALKRIDREIAKYPADQKQSAVMAALAIAQDEKGWLSTETMDFVAAVPRHAADRRVRGRDVLRDVQHRSRSASYKLTICTNLPCALQGATKAAEHLKQKLGIGFDETTADGLFTLKEGECFGACGDAPVLLVNNKRMCSWMHAGQARRAARRVERGREATVNAPSEFLDYGPDAIIMAGLNRQELAARRLRRARRLRGAEEDPRREDSAGDDHRRSEEVGAARPRRRGFPDRAQVELHAAAVRRRQVPRLQFRRGRAGHVQGSRHHALQPAHR